MAQTFRVTTYALQDSATAYTGTSYTLQLEQALERNYFVIIQEAGAGDLSANNDRGPDSNYCRVSADPFGTGDLGVSGAADELDLVRGGSTDEWKGFITVVECLGGALAEGFRLVDVKEVAFNATQLTKAVTCAGWDDIGQVGLYGGLYGGGASTAVSNAAAHQSVWARIYPSGTDSVNLKRILTGGTGTGAATFTVYVVEWGSEWSIQRANIYAASNTTYESATNSSVVRDNTFVLGFGAVGDQGIGDGWDAMVCTLGNAQTQNANETQVTLATAQSGNQVDAEVYVHTHADLAVDYRGDGSGIPTNTLQSTLTVEAAVGTETYDNTHADVRWTKGTRFALMTNSLSGTGNEFPRPQIGARPTASTTVTWSRTRKGSGGGYWVEVVDFDSISRPATTTLTPGATAISLAAPAAVLALSLALSPPATSLALAAPGPAIALGTLAITPPATGLSLQAPAPVVGLGALNLAPPPTQLALAAPSPAIALGALQLTPPATTLALAAPAGAVGLGPLILSPSPTTLALAAPAGSIALGALVLQPSPAVLSLTAPAIVVDVGGIPGRVLLPGPTVLELLPPAPSVGLGTLVLSPPPGILQLSPPPPAVTLGQLTVAPPPTSLALTAPPATVLKTLELKPPRTVLQLAAPEPALQLRLVLPVQPTQLSLAAPPAQLIAILLRPSSAVLALTAPAVRAGPVETYRDDLRAVLTRAEALRASLLQAEDARAVLERFQVAIVTLEHAKALGAVLEVSEELKI